MAEMSVVLLVAEMVVMKAGMDGNLAAWMVGVLVDATAD